MSRFLVCRIQVFYKSIYVISFEYMYDYAKWLIHELIQKFLAFHKIEYYNKTNWTQKNI